MTKNVFGETLSLTQSINLCIAGCTDVCVYCMFVAYASQLDALLTKKIEMLTKLKGIVVRLDFFLCTRFFPTDIHFFMPLLLSERCQR